MPTRKLTGWWRPAGNAAPEIRTLFSGGVLPFERDQAETGQGGRAHHHPPARRVRVVNYPGSGIETTFTQGEDAPSVGPVPLLPRCDDDQVLLVGTLADGVEDRPAPPCSKAPWEWGGAQLPPRPVHRPASVGRPAPRLPVGPGRSSTTPFALERRAGARRLPSPLFPLGRRAARLGWAARRCGLSLWMRPGLRRVLDPWWSVGRRALVPLRRQTAEGKRLFLSPNSSLEIPLARFSTAVNAHGLSGGRAPPTSNRTLNGRGNWPCCPIWTQLSEGQDLERQREKGPRRPPILVVCGPWGLAKPLEGQKHRHPSSIELGVQPHPMASNQAADLPNCLPPPAPAASFLQWELAPLDLRSPPSGGDAHRRFDEGLHFTCCIAPQGRDTYADRCFFFFFFFSPPTDDRAAWDRRRPFTYTTFRPVIWRGHCRGW